MQNNEINTEPNKIANVYEDRISLLEKNYKEILDKNNTLEKRISDIEGNINKIITVALENKLKEIEDKQNLFQTDLFNKINGYFTNIYSKLKEMQSIKDDINHVKTNIKTLNDISVQYKLLNKDLSEIKSQFEFMRSSNVKSFFDINTHIETLKRKQQTNSDEIKANEKKNENLIKSLMFSSGQEKSQFDSQIKAIWDSIALIVQEDNK